MAKYDYWLQQQVLRWLWNLLHVIFPLTRPLKKSKLYLHKVLVQDHDHQNPELYLLDNNASNNVYQAIQHSPLTCDSVQQMETQTFIHRMKRYTMKRETSANRETSIQTS